MYRVRYRAVLFLVIVVTAFNLFGEKRTRMGKMEDPGEFKKRCGIVPHALTLSEEGVFVTPWDSVVRQLFEDQSGTEISAFPVAFKNAGVFGRTWNANVPAASLQIGIYALQGYEAALSCMVENASRTSMSTIPFKRAGHDAGNLMLVPDLGPLDCVLFVYKNIFFNLSCKKGSFDLINLAGRLATGAEPYSLKKAEYFPPLLLHPEASNRISLNATVVVEFKMIPEQKTSRFDAFVGPGKFIRILDINRTRTTLQGIKTGSTKVNVVCGDTITFLSATTSIDIEIVP